MLRGKRSLCVLGAFLVTSIVVCVGCSSGGSGSDPVSDPAAGVFAGSVLDDQGNPIVGARVSIGGILKALREGDDEYVEIEMNLDNGELVGKWRTGTNPPFDVHSFYPYEEE